MKHTFNSNQNRLSLQFENDVLSTTVKDHREKAFEALGRHETSEWKCLELDLTDVNMIDSAGLNLLVAIIRQAQARNARVCARVANDNVRRTISFTRLDRHLEVLAA